MRALLFAASLLVAMACAAPQRPAAGVTTENVQLRGPGSRLNVDLHHETFTSADTIRVAPARVWNAIPRAFASLGLALELVDSTTASVSTGATAARGTLGGKRLSHYFSCGQTPLGANADSYPISIRAQTSMQKLSDSAVVVRSLISATARRSDNGASAVRCESRGTLERRVLEQIVAESSSPR